MQLCVGKCISKGKEIACVTFLLPRHMGSHMGSHMPSLEDLSPLSGGWILLCKELVMAGDVPHITMLCIIF